MARKDKPSKVSDKEISRVMRELGSRGGKRGGKKGGKARWEGVSKADRSEAMRRAVKARWAKKKGRGAAGN